MDKEHNKTQEEPTAPSAPDGGSGAAPEAPPKNAKERLYDKIPLTVKQLDIILVVLAVAFVVFLVLGALVGNGILPGLRLF